MVLYIRIYIYLFIPPWTFFGVVSKMTNSQDSSGPLTSKGVFPDENFTHFLKNTLNGKPLVLCLTLFDQYGYCIPKRLLNMVV